MASSILHPVMTARRVARGTGVFILACAALLVAAPAAACTLDETAVVGDLGPFSPPAIKEGAVPAQRSRAGIICPSALLTLLDDGYLRATFSSGNAALYSNALRLRREDGLATVAYAASADPNGATRFTQGATIDYMQNNLLNVLGLLGGSSGDLPIFVKPGSATLPPAGIYKDKITISWNWYRCPGGLSLVGLLRVCLSSGELRGQGTSTIDVTLTVAARRAVLTTTATVTWDPVNGTRSPKALPGSRRRVGVDLRNTDLVPLDAGTLVLVLPTPAGTQVALDGDGASSGPAVAVTEGTTPSNVTIRYAGPTDAGDDVDFSSDGGASWLFAPTAGGQGAVTHVRIRPQGKMARESSFLVSVPYLVR